jgi:hypothetical protein
LRQASGAAAEGEFRSRVHKSSRFGLQLRVGRTLVLKALRFLSQ